MFSKKSKLFSLLSLSLMVLSTACNGRLNQSDTDSQVSILSKDAASEDSQTVSSIDSFVLNSYRAVFNEYDLNKNGVIEPNELSQAPNSFKALDRNNDKRLTFDEIKPSFDQIKKVSEGILSFYTNIIKAADTNKDGFLSAEEMANSTELKNLQELDTWNTLKGNFAKNGQTTKGIGPQEFYVLMNNSLSEVQRKMAVRKMTKVNSLGTKRPVILVQGYSEPSWYFMYGIYRNLKKSGWDAIYPVNLFPNIADIKEQAKIVSNKIEQAKKEQGVNKVDYVAHSMGGLIGRYYIQEMGGVNSIEHFVSISTPHYGTYVAWAGIGDAAKQMRPGSEFLSKLNSVNPIQGNIKYSSIWTKTDEIVVPAENAVLNGSKVFEPIKAVGHFFILWSDVTYKDIKDSLTDNI